VLHHSTPNKSRKFYPNHFEIALGNTLKSSGGAALKIGASKLDQSDPMLRKYGAAAFVINTPLLTSGYSAYRRSSVKESDSFNVLSLSVFNDEVKVGIVRIDCEVMTRVAAQKRKPMLPAGIPPEHVIAEIKNVQLVSHYSSRAGTIRTGRYRFLGRIRSTAPPLALGAGGNPP
jgi:hypothetical protein